jgi:hypothetical protein
VVSPADLDEQERSETGGLSDQAVRGRRWPTSVISSWQRWMAFRNHRNTGVNPLSERLLRAQRMFEGKYDPEKLVEY